MRRHFLEFDEMITVRTSEDGNEYRVLTYNGEEFAEPYFTGQELGWVKYVLWEWKSKSFSYLIVTPTNHNIWLTVSMSEANKFEVGTPLIGAPSYFCIIQKVWHKAHTCRYTLYELWYEPNALSGYKKPEWSQIE